MRRSRRWLAGAALISVLLLPACKSLGEEEPGGEGPARIEAIRGTERVRVIMTAEAAERLDIQTALVRPTGKTADSEAMIPHASVFYGPSGEVWTYTNPEPLTYERASVEVDRIDGDLVFLSNGPPAGTAVVTRGASELFGIETGVDES